MPQRLLYVEDIACSKQARIGQTRLYYNLFFLVGIVLRVALSLLNGDANDDHITVIRAIAFDGQMPTGDDQWEAFQPKLYHSTVATILKLANSVLPFISSTPAIHVRVGNLLACGAGIVTLWILLKWLQKVEISDKARLITFGIWALNPKFIATNSQTTNDSFVIMFGVIAIYFGYLFLRSKWSLHFFCFLAAAAAAGLSKGNGMVIFLTAVCVFGVAIVRPVLATGWNRIELVRWAAAFIVVYVVSLAWFGPYVSQYHSTGSPITINIKTAPPPSFLEMTEAYRPGIRSIVDGLFTFRFFDLLRDPRNVYSPLAREAVEVPYDKAKQFYPDHQTSLWSQLYGHFHSLHFDYWPISWRLDSEGVTWLIRISFLLGLVPTLVLVQGVITEAVHALKWIFSAGSKNYGIQNLLVLVSAYGFLGFVVTYAIRYRDYGVLKAIFLFPGLLGFSWCFARAYDRIQGHLGRYVDVGLKSFHFVVGALLVTYVIDVVILIAQQFAVKLGANG